MSETETPPEIDAATAAQDALREAVAAKNARNEAKNRLADDLLEGAGAIAAFMFGDEAARRKVYHLLEDRNAPPFFKLGSILCIRKSALLAWIAEQERAAR